MSKRIKHNNLLPWFQEDHAQLPKAYVKSCEKFFRELGKKPQASSSKPQASSSKPQATSDKLPHVQTIK
jgi:hypothetical protein